MVMLGGLQQRTHRAVRKRGGDRAGTTHRRCFPTPAPPTRVHLWRPVGGIVSASALRRALGHAVAAVGAAVIVSIGLSTAYSAPAAAAAGDVGYVRLAHLSPDTPDVDVYLSSTT